LIAFPSFKAGETAKVNRPMDGWKSKFVAMLSPFLFFATLKWISRLL
jgi:hypothetical protein